jgi:hypothetical protein
VLHHLVAGTLGTTTNDVRLPRSLLDGDSILTNVLKPDVVEVARAKAVDTLSLVSANDDVP